MAILPILQYPDPRLRNRSKTVKQVSFKIRQLVDDMLETMYEAPGIGLAAPQVDCFERIVVIDLSENRDRPLVLINPEIVESSGAEEVEEGCLSVPGIYEMVERAQRIRVRALNRDGNRFELEAEGLEGVCIQHEIDHLEGKLFVDYISEMKRQRIKKKMEKLRRKRM